MTFRSPLLKAVPKDRHEGAAALAIQRLFISFLVVLTIGTLFYLVRTKALPLNGFFWLYWFHDTIYLVLKGKVVTRFFPWSLAWIGVGGTLLFIAWLTYVLGKSPLQAPHAFLVRWATRNAALHPLLTGIAELFKRAGFPMIMMREAIDVARKQQLGTLLQLRDKSKLKRVRHQFLRQTDLYLGLAWVYRDEPGVRQTAIRICLETLLWSKPVTKLEPKSPEHQLLSSVIARAVHLLPLPSDAKAFNQAIAWPGSLQQESLALDTLLLFSAFVPGGEKRLGQALVGMEKGNVGFADLVRLRLVQATEDRIRIYEDLRLALETNPFGPISPRKEAVDVNIPSMEVEPDTSACAAQAVLLACHTAGLTDDIGNLPRYLEALEALSVATDSSSPSPDAPMAQERDYAAAITKGLPTTEMYRFATQLAHDMESRNQELRHQWEWPEGLPGIGVAKEPWSLAQGMQLAAGREAEKLLLDEVAS